MTPYPTSKALKTLKVGYVCCILTEIVQRYHVDPFDWVFTLSKYLCVKNNLADLLLKTCL